MPPNENDTYVSYAPVADWPRGDGQPTDKAGLIKAIQAELDKRVPGQTYQFAQPIEMLAELEDLPAVEPQPFPDRISALNDRVEGTDSGLVSV